MNVTDETSNNIQIQLLIEQEHTKQKEIEERIEQQRTEQYRLRLQIMEEHRKNKEQIQKHGYLEYDSNS